MKYYLFLKAETAEDTHKAFAEVFDVCNSYECVELHTGWWAARAKFSHDDAGEALESKGLVVWPHLIDHTEPLEDRHHVGIIPMEAGIESGDTSFIAAKKLWKHLGGHAAFKPTSIY